MTGAHIIKARLNLLATKLCSRSNVFPQPPVTKQMDASACAHMHKNITNNSASYS